MKFPKPWYRKSRGLWFVTLDGQQIKLGEDKKLAFALYKELLAKPQKRTVRTDSLLAIIDVFLEWCQKHRAPDTYEWYRYRLERFARRYPDLRCDQLRPYHVQEWLDDMELSSGSKRNYCRAIKRCLRWAKKQGYIEHNAIADLEQPRGGKRDTMVSDAEFEQILNAVVDESFRELLTVTWETGCRPQESLRVEASNVDVDNQRWIFPEIPGKTDEPRIVYLPDGALDITKRLMLRYPKGRLFRNSRGKPWTTDSVNSAFIRVQIKLGREILEKQHSGKHTDGRRQYVAIKDEDAREFAKTLSPTFESGKKKSDAELLFESRRKLTYREATRLGPKYCLYVLRHSWMNRLLTRGVDSLTVAFLAGHADPSTLARVYAHLSQDPAYMLQQAKKATSKSA